MRATQGMQIKIYMGKFWRIFQNEQGWKTFISAAIIAGMVSLVASDGLFEVGAATSNGAFALICACIWIGIFNSIQSVCKERDIIKREHRTGLLMSSYILAHILFDTILCAVEALIVALILFIVKAGSLPESGALFAPVLEIYLTFFFTILCSDALGLMVSSIVKTPNSAMTVMPFVLIVQFVMSGKIFALEGVSEVIAALTVSKWGLNAVCATADVNHLRSAGGIPLAHNSAYDCDPGNVLLPWLLLLLFTAVYCAIAIAALQRIDQDKR